MTDRRFLIVRSLWKHLYSVVVGAFGLFLLLGWAIIPVPSRKDLIEVQGALSSYTVEADQSWFAQHLARRRTVTVLFKIAGSDGRFWNDAVGPGNVRSIFPQSGVAIRIFRDPHNPHSKINGDGEKTYGLMVDGTEIRSVDEALGYDSIFAYFVLPALGLVALGLAVGLWRKVDREAAASSHR
jgi:hypothetical protein